MFLFSEVLWKWLENALDVGLKEEEFWNMTLGEVKRYIESKNRVLLNENRQKANFDYLQAITIVKGMNHLFNSSAKFPDITEIYPNLFDAQKQRDDISAIRFRQFANSFNKFKKGVAKPIE